MSLNVNIHGRRVADKLVPMDITLCDEWYIKDLEDNP